MSEHDHNHRRSGKLTDDEYRHLAREGGSQYQGMSQNRGQNAAARRNEGDMEDVWRESVRVPTAQRRQRSGIREGERSASGVGSADFNRNQTVGAYNDRSGYGRQQLHTPDYRGRGPKGYSRSDQQILEDVCESLTDDPYVDASDVTVSCKDGIVTLAGSVPDRRMKFRAEDLVDQCRGVRDIHNRIRTVAPPPRH